MKINLDNLDSFEQEVRIEIVPLIDVIFCILTFFILAAVTLTRQTAINVDLPKAETGATQMRKLLIVSVDSIGQTYVEKLPVTREQLHQALVNFQKSNPDGLTVLYASRASSYNDVVQVLDLLRSVGGNRVALATLPDGNGSNQLQSPGTTPGTGDLPGLPGGPTSPGLANPTSPQLPDLGLPGTQPQNAPLPNQSLPGGADSPLAPLNPGAGGTTPDLQLPGPGTAPPANNPR